jgi:hypothetical protein
MMDKFYTMPIDMIASAENAMDEIDWHRIHRVMEFVEWTWVTSGGHTPEPTEMKRAVRELCYHAYKAAIGETGRTYSGGFQVLCDPEDKAFEINFILERGESWEDRDE